MAENSVMSLSFKRACVTGGAGFIGSALTTRLLDLGMEVSVLDNLSVGKAGRVANGAKLIVGDIRDSAACKEALAGCDILFHLAARVAIRSSFEFVVDDASVNVVGTASILRAAADSGTVRKVLSASSMGVYSDSDSPTPIPETHPTQPVAPYGISKLATEQLTHLLAAKYGMESVVLRLFNTYGPGQTLSPYVGVVTIFVNRLAEGEAPVIYGDGRQARDFVHVEDIAQGFVNAMDAPISGVTLNLGTGRATTVRQIFEILQATLGTRVSPRMEAAPPGELLYSIADISKARRLISYSPRHEIQKSLPEAVEEILALRAGSN